MANRNALPIFSTSQVDSGLLKASPRRPTVTTPRRLVNTTTPLSSTVNKNKLVTPLARTEVTTPTSLNKCSRQKWRSASSLDSSQVKFSKNYTHTAHGNHSCSPSLSPKANRAIARFSSDTSLNDSTSLDNSILKTPTSPRGETSNFIVGVRVRPFSLREEKDKTVRNVVSMQDNEVSLRCASGTVHMFSYDHCFWSFNTEHTRYANQETVFCTMVEPLLDQLLLGYNACLLAYGQTGSGKSYSMMGLESGSERLHAEAGVIPRFCHTLFKRAGSSEHEVRVEISYYEIYNEKIHDLLASHKDGTRPPLRVRENPTHGPYVVDLSVHGVTSFADVKEWLTVGNSHRITAATNVNEKSSRSHSIFSVMVTQKKDGVTCRSRANLVDLAGSERVAHTAISDHQLKEGVSINKSLLSLGKVITFLSERGRRRAGPGGGCFGPYRESVLTWLLRESLGGNSKTAMLATVSPANIHLDETLATLRYACQARTIVNRVHPNEDPNERIIRELRMELEKMSLLKAELDYMKKQTTFAGSGAAPEPGDSKQAEIDRLKQQLKDAEAKVANDQRPWQEKVEASSHRRTEELQYLRGCGVALQTGEDAADPAVPCLVTLSPDPILSGCLLYMLPPGRKAVGRSPHADIVLHSPLVAQRHCEIENRGNRLWVRPIEGEETFVNGVAVTRETELLHGDRLAIAGIHFFRLRAGANQRDDALTLAASADFEHAQKELKREQEARLRSELRTEMDNAHEKEMHGVLALLNAQAEPNTKDPRDNSRDAQQDDCNLPLVETYKSTFLDDLYSVLARSRDVSLLDMHLLVREASQRCRDLSVSLDFSQEQLLSDNGLVPVIRVYDRDSNRCSLWKHSDFFSFLDTVRESATKTSVMEALNKCVVVWECGPAKTNTKQRESSGISAIYKPTTSAIERTLAELEKQQASLQMASQHDAALRDQLQKALPHFRAFVNALTTDVQPQTDISAKSVHFTASTAAS